MKILLLEDDLILNEILQEHLESQNYIVTSTFNAKEAQDALYKNSFDLLLLDVNVPYFDGFTLLKELRENSIFTPAIFITSLNMIEDMQKGFESGAQDYIKKPFLLKELDLRINNLKKLLNIDKKLYKIEKDLEFDKENLQIIKNNNYFSLSKKESEILNYLINSEKTVSIEELINNIWAYEESIDASTIRTYIKSLRKIIGEDKILNTRGVGYRFNK